MSVARVAAALRGGRIDFLVTGSTAMNFYADPRSTGDIDLLVDVHPTAFDPRVRPLLAPPASMPAVAFAPPDHLGQLTDEHGLRFDLIMRPGPWTAVETWARALGIADSVDRLRREVTT